MVPTKKSVPVFADVCAQKTFEAFYDSLLKQKYPWINVYKMGVHMVILRINLQLVTYIESTETQLIKAQKHHPPKTNKTQTFLQRVV